MRKHRHGEVVNVVGDTVVATAKPRASSSRAPQGKRAARGSTEGEHGRRPCRKDEAVEVGPEGGVEGDPLNLALERDKLCRVEHAGDIARRVGLAAQKKAHLDKGRWIADADAEEEAIAAKSCGFCVAMTKKGSGRGMVWPSSETCPSFMASRRADWVRGLARLISSARRTFAKIGPCRRTNSLVRPSKTETPTTSLGNRSLVN